LLVTGVFANDPHDALAAYDLALLTNLFDAGSDLHGRISLVSVGNAATGGVIRADFDGDSVAR
jgi:hypothetical protein